MILFSWRKKLAEEYKKWLFWNPMVKDCPENVIAFLAMHNLLDTDAVKKYLEGLDKEED